MDQKKSIQYLLIAFGVIGAIFYFYKKQKIEKLQSSQISQEKNLSASDKIAPSTQLTLGASQNIQKNLETRPSSNLNPNELPKSPISSKIDLNSRWFCPTQQNPFVVLPSSYIRLIKKTQGRSLPIPDDLAQCLKPQQTLQFYFFEYFPSRKFPWKPLISMNATVTNIKATKGFAHAIKELESHPLAKDRNFMVYKRVFSMPLSPQMGDAWYVLDLKINNFETTPTFWPNPPPVLSGSKILKLTKEQMTNFDFAKYKIVDLRKSSASKNFPIRIDHQKIEVDDKIPYKMMTHPHDFLKKWKIPNIAKDQNILLIGEDGLDFTPYNYANFLTLNQFTNVSILDGGVVKNFYSTALVLPNRIGRLLSATELQNLIKTKPRKLKLIDVRNPKTSSHFIGGAVPFYLNSYKKEKLSPQEIQNDSQKIEDLNKSLEASPDIDKIIFLGSNAFDNRIRKAFDLIRGKKYELYEIKNGMDEWYFYKNYVWDAFSPGEKSGNYRFSPRPPQTVRKVDPNKTVFIPAPKPEIVPASPLPKNK